MRSVFDNERGVKFTWHTPRTMDIFILYELEKMSAFSLPCQPGSRPKG
jgi:hypothetical protein